MKYKLTNKKTFALALATTISSQVVPAYSFSESSSESFSEDFNQAQETEEFTGVQQVSQVNTYDISTVSENSGINTLANPTQQKIIEMYKALPDNFNTVYTSKPDYTQGTYGTVDATCLSNALQYMNYIRFVCGLDYNLTLSEDYNKKAQAASFAMASTGEFTHNLTTQPTGMSNEDYALAGIGASKSNIASSWTSSYTVSSLKNSITGWMSDNDDGNISVVGHRRCILNPALKITGFGIAENTTTNKTYSANYVIGEDYFDNHDIESVAWPAQNMPLDLFKYNDPWSYSSYYSHGSSSAIDVNDVKVVLQKLNQSGGTATETWTFVSNDKSENYNSSSSLKYFNTSSSYGGQYNDCLIFRPDNISSYADGDVFKVTITNLDGSKTIDTYEVNFFDVNNVNSEITAEKPTFTTNLSTTKVEYVCNATADVLSVTANVKDGGVLSYQWYKDGNAIINATNSTYTPSTSEVATSEYYCIVTNTLTKDGSTGTSTTQSNKATIDVKLVVVNAEKPVIKTDLSTSVQAVGQGSTDTILEIEVEDVTDGGVLSYQWYKDGNAIINATNSTYTPSTSEVATSEYYCIVTNTLTKDGSTGTSTTQSNKATIDVKLVVVNAETPVIKTDLSTSVQVVGTGSTDTILEIEVEDVKDEGVLSYQWYKDGNAIINATNSTYTPSTSEVATSEYYCVVTNTLTENGNTGTSTTQSETATIQVKLVNAETPVIKTDLSTSVQVVGTGSTDTKLEIEVEELTDGGVLSYQWYKDGVVISNATNSTYTPSTSEVATSEYYCIVTNTNNNAINSTSTTQSETATIQVKLAQAEEPKITTDLNNTPVIYNIDTDDISSFNGELSITVADVIDGDLSYQWYLNKVAISGATDNTYTVTAPDENELGIKDYYCIVTNTNSEAIKQTATIQSKTAKFIFESDDYKNAETPTIEKDLSEEEEEVKLGKEITLEIKVTVSSPTAELAYNWYKVVSGGNDELVYGTDFDKSRTIEDYSTYTPEITEAGTHQYYCLVTNTDKSVSGDNENTMKSEVMTIIVSNPTEAQTPTITQNLTPSSVSYMKDSNADTLEIKVEDVTDGGDLSYQWYKDDIAISTATNSTYTPPTSEVGINEYYCKVTNTNNNVLDESNRTAIAQSSTISIIVNDTAKVPTITTNLSTTDVTYTKNATATDLKVIASSSDGGTLSYQWYKDGVVISTATNRTYTPSTSEVGTSEYYCTVTNTVTVSDNNSSVNSKDSNTATIIVKDATTSSSSSSSSSSSNSSSSSTGSTSSSSGSGASLNASSNTSTSTGSNTSSNSNTSSSSNNSVDTSFVYTAFSDISGVQWSHNAIKYMNENTYMLGKGNGNFSPNETMTNEMFITVLSRFAQADINTTGEVYYTGAVSWANNNGIATELKIGSGISREDMAIYLYNYADTLGLTLPTGEATSDFADTTSLSSQSQTAINALQDAGVINGNGDGTYKPSQTATRAEVCQMLWKFALNVIDAQ